MKLKEINRNGFMAWSPKSVNRSYLAVGTASQQLDSSFSSKAQLEIFEYDPKEKGSEMPVVRSFVSDTKFSKLLWGNVNDNLGLIVGGTESGILSIYDCKSLLDENQAGGDNLTRATIKREHKGPVNAMDFNKFKPNLLATGGAESDIFIWDLDKFDDPMTPGNKSQPFEDIRSLSWNHKVQHILGSTSTHRCQIWDLRKSDPVIKLSDTQMKMKCKKIIWHPEISTRLCISSEDDHTPIIQLWDLRYIQCPFHTLQKHTKGIVDLEWCLDDPDILMSIGRERQLICWNMSAHNTSTAVDSSSESIYEYQLDQELINEAKFCPKHPGLVAVSSFDCHISLYSLMGGRDHVSRELSDTVTDSFPLELNEEDNDEIERVKKEAEKAAELQLVPTPCLLKAPKWLKRPCGARFSFAGKLVQFCKSESSRSRNNSVSQAGSIVTNESCYKVYISQVITHRNLVEASRALENATQESESLLNYCQNKIEVISNQIHETENRHQKSTFSYDLNIWKFIECHLIEDSRSAFMQNLGYKNSIPNGVENSNHRVTMIDPSQLSSEKTEDPLNEPFELPMDNIQLLPKPDGTEKDLSVALMTGDIDSVIDICLDEDRTGEAAILAVSWGRQDLFEKVQKHVFQKTIGHSLTTKLIYIAVKRNWHDLVNKSDLNYWKETLVWLLTYANTEELSDLCETLGRRLEEAESIEGNNLLSLSACICYICSGSVNSFVRCWLKTNSVKSTKDLQRLIEMIILLCKSIGDDEFSSVTGKVAEIFQRYASLIASQGNLSTALKYMGDSQDANILMLRHRICENLRQNLPHGVIQPKIPFTVRSVFTSLPKRTPITKPASSVAFVSDKMKFSSQVPSAFPGAINYPTNQGSMVNNVPKQTVQKMPPPSDAQLNYTPSQFPCTSKPPPMQQQIPSSTQPPISNTMPHSYIQPPFNPHPSGMPLSQLPFIPQQPSAFLPVNAPPPPMPASIPHQKVHNQTSKSGWNDPPLLSENYRSEVIREEVKIQQNFFNPTASITEISDVPNLGNIHLNSNFPGNIPQYVNPGGENNLPVHFDSSTISGGECDVKECELSEEYRHIQTVLLNLIGKCREQDKSRQTKVKMDDIQKKINNLFEVMKTQSLSPELTNGLISLTSTLVTSNYRQSFDEVNNLIQAVNFSEAGVFLPTVKMLIQCAVRIFP